MLNKAHDDARELTEALKEAKNALKDAKAAEQKADREMRKALDNLMKQASSCVRNRVDNKGDLSSESLSSCFGLGSIQ